MILAERWRDAFVVHCMISLYWSNVSECSAMTEWMFTWYEMNKRVDSHTNNRFHNIWVTSVRRSESIILASGIFSNSCRSAGQHAHTRGPYHTHLCHPSKQEDVGLLEDRFHVVAMVTAPPSWQDNRNSSATCVCFLGSWFLSCGCVVSDENTSLVQVLPLSLSQGHNTEGHWALKVIPPTQKCINRCME